MALGLISHLRLSIQKTNGSLKIKNKILTLVPINSSNIRLFRIQQDRQINQMSRIKPISTKIKAIPYLQSAVISAYHISSKIHTIIMMVCLTTIIRKRRLKARTRGIRCQICTVFRNNRTLKLFMTKMVDDCRLNECTRVNLIVVKTTESQKLQTNTKQQKGIKNTSVNSLICFKNHINHQRNKNYPSRILSVITTLLTTTEPQ